LLLRLLMGSPPATSLVSPLSSEFLLVPPRSWDLTVPPVASLKTRFPA
jgi:hypothetical protein